MTKNSNKTTAFLPIFHSKHVSNSDFMQNNLSYIAVINALCYQPCTLCPLVLA